MDNNISIMLSTPSIKIGNIQHNLQQILNHIQIAKSDDIDLIIFGKNALTSNHIGSMVHHNSIISAIDTAIDTIVATTQGTNLTIILHSYCTYKRSLEQYTLIIHNGIVNYHTKPMVDTNINSHKLTICLDIPRIRTYNTNIVVCIHDDVVKYDNIILDTLLTYKLPNTLAIVGMCINESLSRGLSDSSKIVVHQGQVMTNDIKQDYTVTDIEISSDEHKTYRLNHNIISKSHNPQLPFVSNNKHHLNSIINILQQSTYRRVKETHNKGVVVGISGGLDSSFVLALSRSIQLRYPDFGEIYAVNMHTHNTSDLSRLNANRLIKSCNAIHIDIPISNQVATHLHDIGHSGAHDITYQNAHARRRSSILLDLSNMYKVLHLGTGDMSEIALGWSTYGGDQLAQFNPNSNLTKTMLRVLLPHISRQLDNRDLQQIAQDIVNAPISPELKPNQKTEEELGPYDFFDFVMYYFVFQRQPIASVYRLCQQHFDNIDSNTIKKHLSTFVDRFFVNQFKRLYGCDGIRVQEYDLNNLIIRSDFDPSIYHQELNNI